VVAEQRMRQWTVGLEVQQRLEKEPDDSSLPRPIYPYVTISREAGAGGGAIGRRVREILGWEMLHREILDDMAERYKLPRDMLDFVDEKTSNWLLECFGKWISQRTVTQSEYLVHLGQMVLMAAQHASTIFVGRGARFLLPADGGLAIFLVAPLAMRTAHVRQRFEYSAAEADKYVRETDAGRRDFVRRHFNRDLGDPHLYDLVINRAHMSEEAAAELIASQVRRRFPDANPA
jgi:cytidylate kinase